MTFNQIFKSDYLFDPATPVASKLYIPLMIIFGLMLALAIVIRLLKGEQRKVFGRYFIPFITIGVLGFLYLFGRYESLSYLNYRFLLLMISSIALVWLGAITVLTLVSLPQYSKDKEKEERFKKYLPGENKSKIKYQKQNEKKHYFS